MLTQFILPTVVTLYLLVRRVLGVPSLGIYFQCTQRSPHSRTRSSIPLGSGFLTVDRGTNIFVEDNPRL